MSPASALNLDPNLENHGIVIKIRDILHNNVAVDREAFKMSVARVQGLQSHAIHGESRNYSQSKASKNDF